MGLLGRITISSSQFANKRGVYAGRHSTRIHVALYRRSRGRLGGHLPGLPHARVLLLDHAGARSGNRRTSPVMYHRDGQVFVVVASKAGQPTNPAWFHNLMAHPDTTIQVGSAVHSVRARVPGSPPEARQIRATLGACQGASNGAPFSGVEMCTTGRRLSSELPPFSRSRVAA
jgi:deazaflavin-dependent oxidoreductase (nitroreductase family)